MPELGRHRYQDTFTTNQDFTEYHERAGEQFKINSYPLPHFPFYENLLCTQIHFL